MELAANYLLGKHDFSTFRSSICQASSPVKTIDTINITSEEIIEGIIYQLNFSAKYFLHHQVRSIVGCLEKVAVASGDRKRCRKYCCLKSEVNVLHWLPLVAYT